MKGPTLSAAVAIAALASSISASVTFNIVRAPRGTVNTNGLKKRQLSERATITEALANNFTGGDYIAQVTVGTPGQTQTLAIDTGSSDVWLLSSTADLCTSAALQDEYQTGGCASTFDASKSSSFKVVNESAFDISYADGSGAQGDYVTDNFSIGGATIKALEMGFAYNVTLQTGLMGIGYDLNEAANSGQDEEPFVYPSIIDSMVSQGLIPSKAYSLYLDDYEASTGSIIFGGLDSDKYSGSLLQVNVLSEPGADGTEVFAEFAVALTGFSYTSQSGSTTSLSTSSLKTPAILDSGTTLTYLPSLLVETLYKDLNVVSDEYSGMAYVACSTRDNNPKMTFNFGFGGSSGISIKVPVSEMIFDLTGLFSTGGLIPSIEGIDGTPCAFGIYDGDSGQGSGGPYILGDTFLRSAYVVYDLSNNLIALAQTNFNSTSSNIVEFQASATSIPDVSGVATVAQVTETNTGILGGAGGPKTTSSGSGASQTGSSPTAARTTTSSNTGSGTAAAATTTTSKSSAASGPPSFDSRGLFVLGISSAFAVLGATFILA